MRKPSLPPTETGQVTGWRRSGACAPEDLCVEIWHQRDVVRIRDSKGRNGPELRFSPEKWNVFLADSPPRVSLAPGPQVS